jgi:hypothetical protein
MAAARFAWRQPVSRWRLDVRRDAAAVVLEGRRSIAGVASEPQRLFDKAGADALLPRLRELIGDLQEIATSDTTLESREHLAKAGQSNGSPAAAASAFRTSAAIQQILEEIRELGVILRDPRSGLCDFPAVREGQPVYLCWQLAEVEVAWWHPRDTGMAGRAPL